MTNERMQSYQAFWLFYLREHSKKTTRALHYTGTALLLPVILAAATLNAAVLLLLPLIGYGFAWLAHFFVEKNRPATFTYPWWSLISDFRMFWLMLRGKLDAELALAGVK